MRRILITGAWRRQLVIAVGVASLAAGLAAATADPSAATDSSTRAAASVAQAALTPRSLPEWPSGGQNLGDDRYQPDETTINVSNAARLAPRWTLLMAGDVSATPAVVDGVVYVPDWGGYLSAINASNGDVIWQRLISSYNGIAGSVSRTDPVVDGDTLIIGTQTGADIIAINTATGAMKWMTRADAHPAAQITGSAVIDRNVVYVGVSSSEEASAENPDYQCCTFRGSVVALSLSTGRLLWKTYTVPPNSGKPGGYSGGAVWGSTPAIDQTTDSVYVGTGNNYLVPAAAAACVAAAMKKHASDANCTAADDYFDSVLSLNLTTGKVNWSHKIEGYDAWTLACLDQPSGTGWCPSPEGQDYDFGSAPNLFTTSISAGKTGKPGKTETLVGDGQKSGVYWAFNAATGHLVWDTLVGPGSPDGGALWGTAADGTRIYVAEGNSTDTPFTLRGGGPEAGQTCKGGAWSALDPATGSILWQTCDPAGATDTADLTVANGVVYAGSLARTGTNMYALNAATGRILWSFASGGSVAAGPAIVGGSVYWGSGYSKSGSGSASRRLYAFRLAPIWSGPAAHKAARRSPASS
jgi:polyvinyl alcohol dehydrogenase (cytochrome)